MSRCSAALGGLQGVAVWAAGEGAGRHQREGKARLAGAGDWQLAMALGDVQQMVSWN